MASFAETFLTARPKDGIDILHERSRAGRALDEELAQYFKERAAIEDQYAKSLVKASKRLYVMDKSFLGNFAPVWDLLMNEFTEISTAHAVLSFKIAEEIEKPLKSPASSEYNKIGKIEPTMQKLAKEFDEHEKKTKKTGEKGTLFKRSKKDRSAKRAMDDAAATWRREGPSFLEMHQNAEEARLQRLKSLVEKFEQIQTDQMLKRMEIANVTMSAATAFDVQNEMREFCESRGSKLAKISRSAEESRRPSIDSLQESIQAPSEHSYVQATGRPEKRSSKVMSALSIRRKNKNASATKLPDNFETIEEVPSEQMVPSPISSTAGASTIEQSNQPQQQSSPPLTQLPPHQPNLPAPTFATQQASSNAPVVDSEGYSIPPPDRSLFTTALAESDAYAENMQSSQRVKFDIHDAAVKTDDDREADATLSRVSSLLRERTPSVARRPRGRRENIRSVQLEPGVLGYRGSPTLSNKDEAPVHANSSLSSRSTTPTNPFHYAAPTDLATPTSLHTTSSSASQSPALSYLQAIPEASQPQIYGLIAESISRTPEHGGTTHVSGSIKILYNGPTNTAEPLLLRVCNVNGTISPNNGYVETWEGHPDVFALKSNAFEGEQRRSAVVAFTYQQDSSADVLPLYLAPSWKCVEGASFLIVKYKVNEQIPLSSKTQLAVCVKFDKVPVTNVQSTPQGSWDPSKKVLTWTTEALQQQQQQQQQSQQQQPARLLAKFTTEGQASPVPINLRYYCKDSLASNVTLEAVPASGSTLQVSQVQKLVKSDEILFAERK